MLTIYSFLTVISLSSFLPVITNGITLMYISSATNSTRVWVTMTTAATVLTGDGSARAIGSTTSEFLVLDEKTTAMLLALSRPKIFDESQPSAGAPIAKSTYTGSTFIIGVGLDISVPIWDAITTNNVRAINGTGK